MNVVDAHFVCRLCSHTYPGNMKACPRCGWIFVDAVYDIKVLCRIPLTTIDIKLLIGDPQPS